MATNPLPRPITVDEFRAMPEPPGDFAWELHYGELVPVTRPKRKHAVLQKRLVSLLEPLTPVGGFTSLEVAFRMFPEFDLRVADVAWVSKEVWQAGSEDDDIVGAPDLVIEVRSKSNTPRELHEKRMLCLTHGCREFWVVEPEKQRIDVTTPDGSSRSYVQGDVIELPLFGPGKSVAVADVFDLSSYFPADR